MMRRRRWRTATAAQVNRWRRTSVGLQPVFNTYMGAKFDPYKDAANIAEHGLSLVEGEGVLNDPLGLTVEDDSSAGESRWITVGLNAGGEMLVVV
jgi:hypothetical protein